MKYRGLWILLLVAAVAAFTGVAPPIQAAPQEAMQMQAENQTASLQQSIQSRLDNSVNFAENSLSVAVTDDQIVLSGRSRDTVDHGRALDIVRAQAGSRTIVDQSTIEPAYSTIR
jgi:Flp pilus assembly secretin CpaC